MAVQTYQLIMRSGPNPDSVYPLERNEIYVGRDISNDIAVNDGEISRKHARLTLQGNTYMVEDLGSTNGTFVDGQRLLGPHTLRPGELIMFGENVGMLFEAVVYDPNATVIAPGYPVQAPPAPPARHYAAPPAQPVYTAPPPQPVYTAPPPQPVYAQHIPVSPVPVYAPPPKKKGGCFKWLMAGCGCLVVVLCLVVVGLGAWYALDPVAFEDAITNIICSDSLKSITNDILNIFGNYSCHVD